MTAMYSIIKDTFRQSLDRSIFWILGAGCSLLIAVVFCFRITPEGEVSVLVWEWKPLNDFLKNMVAGSRLPGIALIGMVQTEIVQGIVGWVGLVVAIVATADFMPAMLEKGGIDLLVARPLGRARIFLAKFLGGCTFVGALGFYLVGGTWLAFGIRSGYWNPGYFGVLAVLVFTFVILYSVSAFAAVLTRSTIFSIIASLGFWAVCTAAGWAYNIAHLKDVEERAYPWAIGGIDTAYLVLPKPGDLGRCAEWLLDNTEYENSRIVEKEREESGGEDDAEHEKERQRHREKLREHQREQEQWRARTELSNSTVVWTSAAFVLVIVGLATCRFSRTDY